MASVSGCGSSGSVLSSDSDASPPAGFSGLSVALGLAASDGLPLPVEAESLVWVLFRGALSPLPWPALESAVLGSLGRSMFKIVMIMPRA